MATTIAAVAGHTTTTICVTALATTAILANLLLVVVVTSWRFYVRLRRLYVMMMISVAKGHLVRDLVRLLL